jgi:hypothetical protein
MGVVEKSNLPPFRVCCRSVVVVVVVWLRPRRSASRPPVLVDISVANALCFFSFFSLILRAKMDLVSRGLESSSSPPSLLPS